MAAGRRHSLNQGIWVVAMAVVLSAASAPTARGQAAVAQPASSRPSSPAAKAEFEVATIKPAAAGADRLGLVIRGRQLTTVSTSLTDLIGFAYGVQAKQIVGGPEWASREKYAVTAVTSGASEPSEDQWREMIGGLLADRFGLEFHHERREMAVFALSVMKGGPKNMTKSTSDSPIPLRLAPRWDRNGMLLQARNVSVWNMLEMFQAAVVDRPVVDQTGLEGRFDFDLKWMPDQTQFGGRFASIPAIPDAAPPLSTAMQEQIGLKIEAVKAPADVIVVDAASRPSEN